jgi:prenyltransferase beta subunit
MVHKKIKMVISLAAIFTLLFNCPALASTIPDRQAAVSVENAMSYLHAVQNKDGGFPVKAGDSSSQGTTCWVIMALIAAGEDVESKDWAPAGLNPIDYLNNSEMVLQSTTDYARLLLALSAADKGPRSKNIKLADKIASFQQTDGHFGQPLLDETRYINTHLWSILALSSAGHEIPQKELAREWLVTRQNNDGGFGWAEGIASDSDDTAIAIQALILLGEDPQTSPALTKAINYLKSCQKEDGGFTSGNDWMSSGSNASSTAWVVQALAAAGHDLSSGWVKGGNNPSAYLMGLQDKSGFYYWKDDVIATPVSTTAQTIMALTRKPYPVNIDYGTKSLPIANPGEDGRFRDLKSSYWAYAPIMSLVEAGVVSGYPDNTFQPEKRVGRAEFTRYLACALNLQESQPASPHSFPDVLTSHWAYRYIMITADKGFVTGRPDGSFDPSGEITGAELAVMLVKALPSDKAGSNYSGPFWYSGYVDHARQAGLLYPDFDPARSASRAQCAYSIVQLRNLLAGD